jgi:hypothetical protein
MIVLRCSHCFYEYVELSLKLKELKESEQEAAMIRTRETCPIAVSLQPWLICITFGSQATNDTNTIKKLKNLPAS